MGVAEQFTESHTPLRIQVRDILTEAVIAEGSSTLRIGLDEWS